MAPEPPATKHGIEVSPAFAKASPGAVDAKPGDDVPWWTPTFSDVAAELRWRWLLFVPAIALIALAFMIPLNRNLISVFIGGWKVIIFAVGIPTAMALRAMKNVVQRRKEPFCIHCGYTLYGLPDDSRCPECGRLFNLKIIDEYRRDPHWFVERWKAHHGLPSPVVPFQSGAVKSKRSRDGT